MLDARWFRLFVCTIKCLGVHPLEFPGMFVYFFGVMIVALYAAISISVDLPFLII